MSVTDHVSLTITQDSVGSTRAGFGVPMVLSYGGLLATRLEYVTTLTDVTALGFATTSPEYLACSALLSQNPHPPRIALGRGDLPPTQVFDWTPVIKHNHDFVLRVVGEGVTPTTCTYSSDGTNTVAETVAAMVILLQAVVGRNFAAVDTGTTHIVITGTAAGDWFSIEQVDVTDGAIIQTQVDPGVATDLAAINLYQSDWYCLLTHFNSNAFVVAAATYIETLKKIYLVDSSDSNNITAVVTSGDTIDDLYTANSYSRTSGWYHPAPAEFLAAALAGKYLPSEPGATTTKFKTLVGVSPVLELTATHRVNLRAKKGNSYETLNGVNVTWEGTRGDGSFIDSTRDLDWLFVDMVGAVFDALVAAANNNEKIPFTDPGIAVIQGEVLGSLERAVTKGILASDPAPVVTVPEAADVSTVNKAIRNLPDIAWAATGAGAIHNVAITGVVSV